MNAWTRMQIGMFTIGVLALGMALPAGAGTMTWTGGTVGTGSNWNDSANWNGGTLPGSNDVAVFYSAGLANNKVISLNAPQAIAKLSYNDWMPAWGTTFTIGSTNDVSAGNTLTLSSVYFGDNVSPSAKIQANVVLAATNSVWDVRKTWNEYLTMSGIISGSGMGLAKWGNGILLLQGGANLYTGETTIQNLGTLKLDFNTTAGPSADMVPATSPLTMNAGTLALNGLNSSGAKRSQSFNTVTIGKGQSSFTIDNTHASAYTRLTLGAISRNAGATLNLTQPTVNTTLSADNGYTTGATNDVTGILGAYMTVGAADWATNNGVNIVAYTGYTTLAGTTPSIADGAASNVRISNVSTGDVGLATSTVTVNTLLDKDAAARTIAVTNGLTLRLGAVGGILTPSGTGALTIGAPGNAGTLTAGGADNTAGELIINNATTVTNNAVIADNGSGAVTLTKSGAGSLVLTAPITHSGGTYLNAGTLRLPGGVNPLSTNGALTVLGGTLNLGGAVQTNVTAVSLQNGVVTTGTIVLANGNYDGRGGTVTASLQGPAGFSKTTPGTLTLAGTSANTYTGDTTVLEGTLLANPSASRTMIPGNLIVGAPNASQSGAPSATFRETVIAFNQAKSITVYPNGYVNLSAANQTLSGGSLTIIGGTLYANAAYSSDNVTMTGGTLSGSFGTTGNNYTLNALASTDTAIVSANQNFSVTFNVADGAALIDLDFSGTAAGARTLTKGGAGVMAMEATNHTYSGGTLITNGTLLVNNTLGAGAGQGALTNKPGASVGGSTLGGIGFVGGVAGYTNANVVLTGAATNNLATLWPGTIDPGTGAHIPGTLTVGSAIQTNNVTFGQYSQLKVQLGATPASCDCLAVDGTLNLGNASSTNYLDISATGSVLKAGTYTIATFNVLTGQFMNVSGPYKPKYLGTPSGALLLNGSIIVSIPPPGTTILVR